MTDKQRQQLEDYLEQLKIELEEQILKDPFHSKRYALESQIKSLESTLND